MTMSEARFYLAERLNELRDEDGREPAIVHVDCDLEDNRVAFFVEIEPSILTGGVQITTACDLPRPWSPEEFALLHWMLIDELLAPWTMH